MTLDPERARLAEDARRERNWKRWGPYLAGRQWGTVREDYSADGDGWRYFPHDHARSRAYRWGEDGLLGFTDRECRLCFSPVLWNEHDPILKERLFGLTGPEGNHGEDVKECYYFLDSLPSHAYASALYKYPQSEFPYARLVDENARRGRHEREFELEDTGIFDDDRYWDVLVEYAKASPDDVLIRITATNRAPVSARLHLLPTLWFRNTWSWGPLVAQRSARPTLRVQDARTIVAEHETLGTMRWHLDAGVSGNPVLLFTENETNSERLWDSLNRTPFVKDGFHRRVVNGDARGVNPAHEGTKAAAWYVADAEPGESIQIRMRLRGAGEPSVTQLLGADFDETFERRIAECSAFYDSLQGMPEDSDARDVARRAYAGLLWSKQFYYYSVGEWLDGDRTQPPPPRERQDGRNSEWRHLYNADVLSMPDDWEYPWYAAWDLAFHTIPLARVDPEFAKQQLLLLLREWYMHPNGQIPAYEYNFSDVNPPVHAWAVWRVYKMTGRRGARDRLFLERAFHKLLLNFTWWVNRKDAEGNNLFAGGFLGLDNIGVFDRSRPLPAGGHLEQADGTAWMAFYCTTMLAIALELAREDAAYEDVASKFFEHFVAITDAINTLGGTGLWDESEGFYYDQIHVDGVRVPLRVRSLVGLIPLLACEVIEDGTLARLPGFSRRMNWFLENRSELARFATYMASPEASTSNSTSNSTNSHAHRLLAIPSRDRLERLLQYLLDEREFLSPHGIRSISRVHAESPAVFHLAGERYEVDYEPAESTTGMFGGNSNWRGPVWFPMNYLIIEALERYAHFFGDDLRVECPVGSGIELSLHEVAHELSRRLATIFMPTGDGRRPWHGETRRYADDPNWRGLHLFHEYFDGDTGRGLGASHQTGWTALVTRSLEDVERHAEVHAHRDRYSVAVPMMRDLDDAGEPVPPR